MKLFKQTIICSLVLALGTLPSFAKIEGRVTKGHFFDSKNTIMTEETQKETIKTEKYWEKNLLYFNKYRPLFMLSNKELYDLMPRENVGVAQRISAPAIYNVSLKTNTLKKISLSPTTLKKPTVSKGLVNVNKSAKNTTVKTVAEIKTPELSLKNVNLLSQYEQAKNPEVDPEKKVDTAILLKNSKLPANCDLALDLLNDVTNKEPYNAYAFYLKGELYTQKEDKTNAMKNYVEALKLNPTSKQSCLGIAKILEPTNKELAQKYYARAK